MTNTVERRDESRESLGWAPLSAQQPHLFPGLGRLRIDG